MSGGTDAEIWLRCSQQSGVRPHGRTSGLPLTTYLTKSASVRMPASRPCSTTGRQPYFWPRMIRAAFDSGSSASIVSVLHDMISETAPVSSRRARWMTSRCDTTPSTHPALSTTGMCLSFLPARGEKSARRDDDRASSERWSRHVRCVHRG